MSPCRHHASHGRIRRPLRPRRHIGDGIGGTTPLEPFCEGRCARNGLPDAHDGACTQQVGHTGDADVDAVSWIMVLGRRRQNVHLLCLTVVFGLLLDPSLASSYGFALSCAAVFGLSTACTRMTAWVSHLLPDRLAKPLAASCCAQLFAGPVQILMDNKVSIWSLPANLLVAPFVNAATILGLCSLFVAWMAPGVSRL